MTLNRKTDNEVVIYAAIKEWWATNGYSPSYRDLSAMAGVSLGTVYSVCRSLRESGKITFTDRVARSIKPKGRK